MRAEIVDELEEFVRRGVLWQPDGLTALIDRLEREAVEATDPIPRLLCTPLNSLLLRMRMGPIPAHVRSDVEAILYPRLWKVMEASRDGLPDAEMRTRIEVMNRRLSRVFAEE